MELDGKVSLSPKMPEEGPSIQLSQDEEDDRRSEDLDWEEWEGCRPERWAPLGANDSDKEHSTCGTFEER